MSKFNVDDRVRVVRDLGIWLVEDLLCLPDNTVLTVVDSDSASLDDREICIENVNDWPEDFELVTLPTHEQTPEVTLPITRDQSESLGVFRPNLEDRKVGKVRVELVDDGFPLALREIAKVMTWAQTAKGYKDHDWQNLPNPEQGLAGATSRHRADHIIQRQVGKAAAIECTDHESELLHKAHEAFGVLAQLELILRGVIK